MPSQLQAPDHTSAPLETRVRPGAGIQVPDVPSALQAPRQLDATHPSHTQVQHREESASTNNLKEQLCYIRVYLLKITEISSR